MKNRKPSKNKSVNVYIPVVELNDPYSGKQRILPPNSTFDLEITYPISVIAVFKIVTGKAGMNVLTLLSRIGKAYQEIYRDPTRYGVWGHSIGDLILAEINVDLSRKTISLSVDS